MKGFLRKLELPEFVKDTRLPHKAWGTRGYD